MLDRMKYNSEIKVNLLNGHFFRFKCNKIVHHFAILVDPEY